MSDCPFVVGEVYKTRGGLDAECIALRPRAGHVIFAIQDETSEYSGSWPLNGILYPDTESCDDILPPAPKGLGLACTVAWTELVIAMRKDGHVVNDSSGFNTRAWIENMIRDTFTAPAAPAAGDAVAWWDGTRKDYRTAFSAFRTKTYTIPLYAAPAAVVDEAWTDDECLAFLRIAFRHGDYSGVTLDDVRMASSRIRIARRDAALSDKQGVQA